MIKSLLFCIFLIIAIGCCKDCSDPTNPDCSNYDPCYGKQETTAEFKIMESIGNKQLETNILFAGLSQGYTFTPIDTTADEYLWEIGTEKITTKTVYRRGFPIDKFVTVKLTVKRNTPSKICYPNDLGLAVVSKTIFSAGLLAFYYDFYNGTIPTTTYKHINGKYRGYNKRNPSHTFDIEYKKSCCLNYIYGRSYFPSNGNWEAPWEDVVNIPYEGFGVYSTFNTPGKYQSINDDKTLDGVKLKDGAGHQSAKNAHGAVGAYEGIQDTVPFSRYYSFFKYYLMLDPKDVDKVTMEYWYVDTITRHLLKDTFIGVRIP